MNHKSIYGSFREKPGPLTDYKFEYEPFAGKRRS
jgi:hypothetical protein